MAFIDTAHVSQKSTAAPGWQALMAQLDMSRVAPMRQRPVPRELSGRLKHMQQMLLAGSLAAGMIIAVAGALMLSFP
jgi:hypothetical protein